jgi:nicotinamide-nucleotide adenylyltransferase
MSSDYEVLHPITLVPKEARVRVDGTMVRRAMARGDDWRTLVPDEVAAYIETHKLDDRFRHEFGLETLAMESVLDA